MNEVAEQTKQKRVLVVDDEHIVGRMTARVLRSAGGFEVATEHEPGVALKRARSEKFDAVVSDIAMPGMDGLELIRNIREFDLDIPVILLTGTPSLESAQRAVELGAYRYLTKAGDQCKLIETVKQASIAHSLAVLKRQAIGLSGEADMRPGDLVGLQESFESALDHLWIAYQPIVNAADSTVFGYECLLRSDQDNLTHPEAIVDAANRLNRLHELGRTIREQAISPVAELADDVVLFVNLHPHDLSDELLGVCNSSFSNLAGRIVLEITERESIDRIPAVDKKLDELRALGFRIAVDDLGAGYAGLSCFATLEPSIVKLDMSLIIGIHTSEVKQRLVRSMVEACHDLGVRIVAEGVETKQEFDCCVSLGCDLLQGYYIAKPAATFAVSAAFPMNLHTRTVRDQTNRSVLDTV